MKVYLSCRTCQACLMEIIVRKGDTTYHVTATCPWCGDKSFSRELKGSLFPGAFGLLKDGCDEDSDMVTQLRDMDVEGDRVTYFVEKAHEAAEKRRAPDS